MHDPGALILWFMLGALAVTGLGAVMRRLSTLERRARRGLRAGLGGRADLVLTGDEGAAAALCVATGRIALRRSSAHAVEQFDQDELVGAELVVDGQVVARCWRGEPRRALDRTPEAPARLDMRLAFVHPAAADIGFTVWSAAGERPDAERGGAVEQARRWFAQMDAIARTPRRTAVAERNEPPEGEN